MPRIMPEPRYFSIPSTVVCAVALRNEALNWTPSVRSVDPGSARLDELAGRDHRSVAEDGDQVALAAGFDPQHAEAVLVVVEGDALNEPGPADIGSAQTFSGRHLNVGSDGTVDMSAEDAKDLIPYGWIKLAECCCDDGA
jgi:hypothetical protein